MKLRSSVKKVKKIRKLKFQIELNSAGRYLKKEKNRYFWKYLTSKIVLNTDIVQG